MSTMFFLIISFGEERHATGFFNGRMWVNPLWYFKALESKDDSGRADSLQGSVAWLQPQG